MRTKSRMEDGEIFCIGLRLLRIQIHLLSFDRAFKKSISDSAQLSKIHWRLHYQ
jgi:hypothetical protein